KSKLLSFLILLGLFLSGSRNSIIAVVVSMVYFIHAYSKKNKPLVFISSLTLILVLYLVIDTLSKHFFQTYGRAESISSLGGRTDIWPYAWQLIMDKPFFGYGFGVEERLFQLKYLVFAKRNYYAHNSYLGMLLQLGIFGFIIFYAPIFILLFKELFSRQDSGTSLLRYALRASVIAGLVSCVFESWVYSVGNAQSFPFWIIIMLLVFCHYRDKEKMVPEGN
ncbi:MAG: O-antigen ligase family protein, partial [Candidatus Omnitrophica bacterium]|nr:O-antigen ligase family protein [Candidatus Omnitrophota bacterium]